MCLKMFALSRKGDVNQWLGLCRVFWGMYNVEQNHGVVEGGNLVEASEDGDQVDRMVVPSQAEVLRGRPTWHGDRVWNFWDS